MLPQLVLLTLTAAGAGWFIFQHVTQRFVRGVERIVDELTRHVRVPPAGGSASVGSATGAPIPVRSR